MPRSIVLLLLAVSAAGAFVARPDWPLHLVAGVLWFGGFWRPLLVPVAAALGAGLLALNTVAPGRGWALLRRGAGVVAGKALLATAFGLGVASMGYTAGLVSGTGVVRAVLLLAMQVVLFPGTPPAVAALGVAAFVAWADARGERVLPLARRWWDRRPRAPERAVAGAATPALVVVASALLTAAVFPTAFQGWRRADPPDACRFCGSASFLYHSADSDQLSIEQFEGFVLGKFGLVLPPHTSGSLVVRGQRSPESAVFLRAEFYDRSFTTGRPDEGARRISNRLELSTDDWRSAQVVLRDTSVGSVVGATHIDLTHFLGTARTYQLRFAADNTTDAPLTILAGFDVNVVLDPLALPSPDFRFVPHAAALSLVVYLFAHAAGAGRRQAALTGIATGFAAVVVAGVRAATAPGAAGTAGAAGAAGVVGTQTALGGAGAGDGPLLILRAGLVAALATGTLLWLRRQPRGRQAPWLALACIVVALVAIDVRWIELDRVAYDVLPPDARGYQTIAREFPIKMENYAKRPEAPELRQALSDAGYDGRASALAVFYAGGNQGREPLWPAALRLVFDALGESAFHVRLASLLLSVGVAALTCWLGWRALHPLAGAAGGLSLALSPGHILNSVLGLREELGGVLILSLVAALFVRAPRGPAAGWWRPAAAGVLAAGMVLLRTEQAPLAAALLTGGAVAMRWGWRRWLAAAAVAALLAGPMYLGYAFTHGDPFYPSTYGALVNRNLEFPERHGTPGFPTREEYATNWASGPKISPLQYMFGYHSVGQVIEYSARGFLRLFPTALFNQQPHLVWLCAAGSALLLLNRRWLVPALLVVSLAFPYSFLASALKELFSGRYVHHALPWAHLAAAYAALWLPIQALEHRHRLRRLLAGTPAARPLFPRAPQDTEAAAQAR